MDYGPSRRAKDKRARYHFWDYESDTSPHVLSLLAPAIADMENTQERFAPADIVKWSVAQSPWVVGRDWGSLS